MKLSIVIPVFNEEKNLPILFKAFGNVLTELGYPYEIIAVNDGSRDGSLAVLKSLATKNKNLKIISFRHNRGQTAALSAGISEATGDVIIPMDSDMENDPADIPKLLTKLDQGFDVVSGWRVNRWNGGAINFLKRKLPSTLANKLISRVTKIKLHDYGCILKVYRREVLDNVMLYGEMHRFIPAYAARHGAMVTEMAVNYTPRKYGKSNYGLMRTFKVVLDLVVIVFLEKYMNRPMHFFGGIGFVSLGIGVLSGLTAIILKIIHLRDFVSTPLPVFSALFIIVGVVMIAMGIIAEILMRTYYESQGKKPYIISEKVNF